MTRASRLLRTLALALAAVLLTAVGAVYGLSQRELTRTWNVPLTAFRAPAADAAMIAEGERLARTRGCFGCHGDDLEGGVFFDEPWVGRIVAPGLARVVPEFSDAELERVIRRGVRRDGRAVWVMASNMYYHLSDEDLGAIIAYLRSVPPGDGLATEVEMRPLGRLGAAMGEFPTITSMIDTTVPRRPVDRVDRVSLGRYLAVTTCTECHGAGLEGRGDTPDLRVAAAYTVERFTDFMRSGIAQGGRDVGLMSRVARGRFSHFTDDEIAALHAYLLGRAAQ